MSGRHRVVRAVCLFLHSPPRAGPQTQNVRGANNASTLERGDTNRKRIRQPKTYHKLNKSTECLPTTSRPVAGKPMAAMRWTQMDTGNICGSGLAPGRTGEDRKLDHSRGTAHCREPQHSACICAGQAFLRWLPDLARLSGRGKSVIPRY